jgi:hypothetical protein
MNPQTSIAFPTHSPVNIEKLSGQNKRLFDYLNAGNKIHCLDKARIVLKIGYLNSRISDLKKAGVAIKKEWVKIDDSEGYECSVVMYSIDNL